MKVPEVVSALSCFWEGAIWAAKIWWRIGKPFETEQLLKQFESDRGSKIKAGMLTFADL